MEHPPAQPLALVTPHLAAQTSSRSLLEKGGGLLLFSTTTTTFTFTDSPGKLLLLEGGRSSQQAARSGICGQKTQSDHSVRVLLGAAGF